MTEKCYLCGRTIGPSDQRDAEHYLGRAFFNRPLPSDLVTFPAHRACNRYTTKDEEYLFAAITVSSEFPGPQERRDRAFRAITRDEAPGFRAQFFSGITPLVRGARLDMPEDRVTYALAKIVKGLIFRTRQIHLLDDVAWWFAAIPPQVFFDNITDDRLTAVNDHDVLAARVAQATDEPRHLAVLLGFFGQHFYAVEVVPADQPGRAVGAPRPMPWYPAPRP